MNERQITPSLFATGVADMTLDLFEGQYRVPNGITYNSYFLSDEKTVLFDTADRRVAAEWLAGVEQTAGGRGIDYLVVSHMEPDHSAAIRLLADRYPAMRIVGNAKTFQMMRAFFGRDFGDRAVVVGEGDALETGAHTIRFYMAPMVHWPEVMVSFDERDGVLFSADAFGRFGLPGDAGDWADEARRYYINIVGKYGSSVQTLLKKLSGLPVKTICPLHGPVLTGDLSAYLEKYDVWSSYRPEERGRAHRLHVDLRQYRLGCAAAAGYARAARREARGRRRPCARRYFPRRGGRVPLRRARAGRVVLRRRRVPADGGFPFPPEGEKLAEAHRRRDRERKLGAVGREDDARGAGRDEGDRAACADRHHPFGRVAGDGRGAQHACGRAGCARITGRRLRQTLWKPKGRLAGV